MSCRLPEIIDLLARTPAVLDDLLRGADPAWHGVDEGPGTWTACDVVGHLLHGEEDDWIPRARMILEHGMEKTFIPFDRHAHAERFAGLDLEQRLDRFAVLRRGNLDTLRGWDLTDAQLALRGGHPAFGEVTLGQLLATWTVHDLGHLAQAARVMAKARTADVGPWNEYLSILHR